MNRNDQPSNVFEHFWGPIEDYSFPFSPSKNVAPHQKTERIVLPQRKKDPTTGIPPQKRPTKHTANQTQPQTQLPSPTSKPKKHINLLPPTEQLGTRPMLYLELHHVSGIFPQLFQVENFATRQQQALLDDAFDNITGWRSFREDLSETWSFGRKKNFEITNIFQ